MPVKDVIAAVNDVLSERWTDCCACSSASRSLNGATTATRPMTTASLNDCLDDTPARCWPRSLWWWQPNSSSENPSLAGVRPISLTASGSIRTTSAGFPTPSTSHCQCVQSVLAAGIGYNTDGWRLNFMCMWGLKIGPHKATRLSVSEMAAQRCTITRVVEKRELWSVLEENLIGESALTTDGNENYYSLAAIWRVSTLIRLTEWEWPCHHYSTIDTVIG